MATNQESIQRVHEFGQAAHRKDGALAARVSDVLVPLLEYEGDLQYITREELLDIRGIGESSVEYFLRVLQGEDIDSADVPTVRAPYRIPRRQGFEPETGSWDGAWDNSVRRYEDG